MTVDIVVPVFRNAGTLAPLVRRIHAALADRPHRVILVDDACDRGSSAVLDQLAGGDAGLLVVRHPRNRGQAEAVLTGLRHTVGPAVVLDADLQDPPEAIPLLLDALAGGAGAVFAGRRGRYEAWWRRLEGIVYRRLLWLLTEVPADGGMFVALSPEAVARVRELDTGMPGLPPAPVAMIGATGLPLTSLPVPRARREGDSSYTASARRRAARTSLRWALAARRHRLPAGDNPRMSTAAEDRLAEHNAVQRRYFERGIKSTMVPRRNRYLARQLDEVLAAAHIAPGDRVLDVGCGMGRYTLLLAERGVRVEGMDLSPFLLERLQEYAAERGLEVPVHALDVLDAPPQLHGSFDAVVALFALHHAHDVPRCLAAMLRLVRPGGWVVACEPNPFNPLFYLQMAARPGMSWAGDGGIIHIRRRPLETALQRSGYEAVFWRRFGFFPPPLTEGRLRHLERPLEQVPLWRPALPFQLFGGRRPAG